jgi:hypothetical protein
VTRRTLGIVGNSPRLFIAAAAAGFAALAAVLPFFFPADRAEAVHPPATVTITVGTPERVNEAGIPEGFLRFRVPITIVNPSVTIGSEFYAVTTPGDFIRAEGFGGFEIIEISAETTYLRNFTGGLGAGTHNVAVIVDYSGCGSPFFNVDAELYEEPFLNHLTARGSRTGVIDTPCDDCTGASASASFVGTTPPAVKAEEFVTLRFSASATRPTAGTTTFSVVEFDAGTFDAAFGAPVFGPVQGQGTTNPSVEVTVSVFYPSCGTAMPRMTIRADFGSGCTRDAPAQGSFEVTYDAVAAVNFSAHNRAPCSAVRT